MKQQTKVAPVNEYGAYNGETTNLNTKANLTLKAQIASKRHLKAMEIYESK